MFLRGASIAEWDNFFRDPKRSMKTPLFATSRTARAPPPDPETATDATTDAPANQLPARLPPPHPTPHQPTRALPSDKPRDARAYSDIRTARISSLVGRTR